MIHHLNRFQILLQENFEVYGGDLLCGHRHRDLN